MVDEQGRRVIMQEEDKDNEKDKKGTKKGGKDTKKGEKDTKINGAEEEKEEIPLKEVVELKKNIFTDSYIFYGLPVLRLS